MQSTFILGSKETDAIMAAAVEKSHALGFALSIAIADSGGHLLAFHRMDTAVAFTVDIAIGKARTAAITREATAVFDAMASKIPAILSLSDTILMQGGLPIVVDGKCIGGIGVSGATSPEDEDVARAALEVLGR